MQLTINRRTLRFDHTLSIGNRGNKRVNFYPSASLHSTDNYPVIMFRLLSLSGLPNASD